MRGDLSSLVAERARRFGPLGYDEVIELALYHEEHGFYARGAGAGRGGADFLTSPEVGPLFGTVLAQALDAWWDELGRPDPYVVAEAGAGAGALAASVLAASPACAPALRYLLVERSPSWRERQVRRLSVEPAALVLGPSMAGGPEDDPQPVPGIGPLVASLPELPAVPFEGVILANELLDNLAFRLFERGEDDAWFEVRVTDDLHELLVEATPGDAAEAERFAPEVPPGARIPLQGSAQVWLRRALDTLLAGRVVVVDYADTTPSLAERPWTEWVRTYREHGRGGHPLERLGDQDVTCEVAVDQLAHVRPLTSEMAQASFLRRYGIDDLVDTARRHWQERAHMGDLDALAARSRVTEGAALTDPSGLGGFRVMEWSQGGRRRGTLHP